MATSTYGRYKEIKRDFIIEKSEEANQAYQQYVGPLPTTTLPSGRVVVDSHNTDVDAFRHAYIAGILAMEDSAISSNLKGEAYELIGQIKNFLHYYSEQMGYDIEPKNKAETPEAYAIEKNMDLWNNRAGRIAAEGCKTKDEFARKLAQDLKDGKLITNPETDTRQFERTSYPETSGKENEGEFDKTTEENPSLNNMFNNIKQISSLLKLKEQYDSEQAALKKDFATKIIENSGFKQSQLDSHLETYRASLQAASDTECNTRGEQLKASTPCDQSNSDHVDKKCSSGGGHMPGMCVTTYHCTIKVDCSDITAKYQQIYDAYVEQQANLLLQESESYLKEQGKLLKIKISDLSDKYNNLFEAVVGPTDKGTLNQFSDPFQNINQPEQILS